MATRLQKLISTTKLKRLLLVGYLFYVSGVYSASPFYLCVYQCQSGYPWYCATSCPETISAETGKHCDLNAKAEFGNSNQCQLYANGRSNISFYCQYDCTNINEQSWPNWCTQPPALCPITTGEGCQMMEEPESYDNQQLCHGRQIEQITPGFVLFYIIYLNVI